jgi:glycosyltransferase involved in cell wall biosynthesis
VRPKMMSECDIFIAPLSHSNYSRGKSYIKALEYGAGKKPIVLEKIEPYQEFAGDRPEEKGVLLAYSEREWFEKMEKLLLDAKLRKENGEKLYNEVKKNHTTDNPKIVKAYADFFKKVYDMPKKILTKPPKSTNM